MHKNPHTMQWMHRHVIWQATDEWFHFKPSEYRLRHLRSTYVPVRPIAQKKKKALRFSVFSLSRCQLQRDMCNQSMPYNFNAPPSAPFTSPAVRNGCHQSNNVVPLPAGFPLIDLGRTPRPSRGLTDCIGRTLRPFIAHRRVEGL